MPHINAPHFPPETSAATIVVPGDMPKPLDKKAADQNQLPAPKSEPEAEPLPYWLVNVSRSQWPSECPEYLRNLPQKSIQCLSMPDAQYQRQSWERVTTIVDSNQIHLLQRAPSDLRRYLEFIARVKATYGSLLSFVVQKRLGWEGDLEPRGQRPFEHPDDFKILYNDWPYGVEEDIVHLVVWTKFELEDDPATDDLTPRMRREIDAFVERTFRSKMPAEKVIWFKNWKSLKSIHGIEHFHVMLYQPDPVFLRDITNGDVPVTEVR
ncbi:uncharacterized protein PADG_04386 [Paracoccidioides brasiliensis Pb18]|uniref:N-acetylglucosamine-induced protein 1 n=1 Tax=Paracoccidioides brasiliensis (strain Pb18) TaxID=502780 RepID=C1GAV0_PARBD|nr:uncharacterized protein PADG_04386 [Paracoccidioides brasiliensis Pb18]EEH48302.2 hypothetical protein PADG_04386 [Paracoccidioides brasiliensis Pb18]